VSTYISLPNSPYFTPHPAYKTVRSGYKLLKFFYSEEGTIQVGNSEGKCHLRLLMIGSDVTKEVLQTNSHISLQLISFPLPAYFSTFPTHYLAIFILRNVGSDNLTSDFNRLISVREYIQ